MAVVEGLPLGLVMPSPVQATVLLAAAAMERSNVAPTQTGSGVAVIFAGGVKRKMSLSFEQVLVQPLASVSVTETV
jgi:hypothetical protein